MSEHTVAERDAHWRDTPLYDEVTDELGVDPAAARRAPERDAPSAPSAAST